MVNKLDSIQKSSKTCWSLLKSFLNNKKTPIIPPIPHNNTFVTDFGTFPVNIQYLTDKSLSSFDFSEDDIIKVIQKLDPNKAHGQDNNSIRMIKICAKSIWKPLGKISEEYLRTGTFPLDWKNGNIVLIFKKGDKQIYKNHRPISLLPIFGKIPERLIFEEIYFRFLSRTS